MAEMKDYKVSYYLGDMYHSYIVMAESEAKAIIKEMNNLKRPELLRKFTIEEYKPAWN